MSLRELILKNRSYRRFDEHFEISPETLKELVDLARYSASARNLQPLRYILITSPPLREKVYPCLAWAGYLADWNGPARGERPTAYIIILNDTRLTQNTNCDQGIAAQSILLGATEKGLGGCIIASIDKERLRKELSIPDYLEIIWVLALGKPAEKVVLEEIKPDGNIQYYRDQNDVHHVPKRKLEQIILNINGESP